MSVNCENPPWSCFDIVFPPACFSMVPRHALLFWRHALFPSAMPFFLKNIQPLRKKASYSAASAQLRSCRKASQKLRKSRRYWHLRKSRLLRRAAKKPAFTKLLRNSAEKLQKSRLFYSFYEAFTQSFVKIVMMSKSCGNAAITQVPIPPAFAKLLHAAFMQTCVKAA